MTKDNYFPYDCGMDTIKPQKDFMRAFGKAGVKDTEIARRAGCSKQFVAKLRHGHAPMTKAVLEAMEGIHGELHSARQAMLRSYRKAFAAGERQRRAQRDAALTRKERQGK